MLSSWSLVGLLLELGGAVRESNIEFFGSLHDGLPVNNGGQNTNGINERLKGRAFLTWSWRRRC